MRFSARPLVLVNNRSQNNPEAVMAQYKSSTAMGLSRMMVGPITVPAHAKRVVSSHHGSGLERLNLRFIYFSHDTYVAAKSNQLDCGG